MVRKTTEHSTIFRGHFTAEMRGHFAAEWWGHLRAELVGHYPRILQLFPLRLVCNQYTNDSKYSIIYIVHNGPHLYYS